MTLTIQQLTRLQTIGTSVSIAFPTFLATVLLPFVFKRYAGRDFVFPDDFWLSILCWIPFFLVLYFSFRFLIRWYLRRFLGNQLDAEKKRIFTQAVNDSLDGKLQFPLVMDGNLLTEEAVKSINLTVLRRNRDV
jgi:hypothetical protein